MRILCVSTWYPYPPDNGSKVRAYHLIRALAGSHDVTVLAFLPGGPGGQTATAEPNGANGRGSLQVSPIAADPFRYTAVPSWAKFLSPIPMPFYPSRRMASAVASAARAGPYDVAIAIQCPVAAYACQIPRAARVLDLDTALGFQLRERYLSSCGPARIRYYASWRKAQLYEQTIARKYDAVAVASPCELAHVSGMLGAGRGRAALVPNGVACAEYAMRNDGSRPPNLIYNGALTYSANFDAMRYFLAEIYPRIKQRMPHVTLTITGSTAGVDLGALQLDESVCLSGYLDDVRPAIIRSAVCVVPLREGGGTRLKILEAMALGAPVVATPKGAEGLEVRDGENILLAGDPARFADQTLRLLQDSVLSRQLALSARELVETRYDWARIGRDFCNLVEDCVAASGRKRMAS